MKKLIGYLRVSTEDQGISGNGLDAQRAAIIKFAEDNQCEVLEIVEERLSAKLGVEDRPVLKAALNKCVKLKAMLIVSKLDRLSRHAAFILNLMDRKVQFVVAAFGFDADSFMIHMYAVLGEKERVMIGQRTKEALQQLKAKGVVLGHSRHKDPAAIVRARANAAATTTGKADDFAMRMKPAVSRMRDAGMSLNAIAQEFNENGTKTARGGQWTPTTVKNLVARWA